MKDLIVFLQTTVGTIAEICIPLIQFLGIIVLLISLMKGAYFAIRRDEHTGAHLARGLALALEFMLGAEILHIILAHEWSDLGVLGVGVIIHILLTLLLHMEVKEEHEK